MNRHTSRRSRRFDGKKLQWLHDSKKFLLLILIVFLFFRFVIGFSAVSGVSMLNTLHNGEMVVYTRLNPSVNRGDIVAVRIPTDEFYVKRVIGIGGDVIDLKDGIVYVNGQPETGSYILGATLPEDGSFSYPYTVATGDLFVLGDNRENSIDSRSFGAISSRQLKGVLRFCFGTWFFKFL